MYSKNNKRMSQWDNIKYFIELDQKLNHLKVLKKRGRRIEKMLFTFAKNAEDTRTKTRDKKKFQGDCCVQHVSEEYQVLEFV